MATLEHKNIPDTELHPPARVAASDPGAIGAGRGWIDTSGSPYLLKIRNGTNTGWDTIGATGIAIGGAVGSGTSGSVLFVDSSGNLAQNNTGLKWTNNEQLLVKTTAESATNSAFLLEFAGWTGSTYTKGLRIRSTSTSAYYPTHLSFENTAYGTTGNIYCASNNGLYFSSENVGSTFVFQDVSFNQCLVISTLDAEPSGLLNCISATRKALQLKAATSQTANILEILNSEGSVLTAFDSVGRPVIPTHTPASASASGVAGTITWDSSYIYICTATNTWKRVAISTW